MHYNLLTKSTRLFEPDKKNSRSIIHLGNSTKSYANNPGWRVAVAKGTNATSGYNRRVLSVKVSMYSCFSESSNTLSDGYGKITTSPIITAKSYTPLIDRATAQIRNKLNGHVGRAQLAAPIAESREIHRLVRQINGLAIDTVKALLAIRKTQGKSVLNLASNVWLGFGFGLSPLLKDIEQAAKSVQDYNSRMDHYVRLKGTATMDWTSGYSIKPNGTFPDIAYGMYVGETHNTYHKQGAQIIAGIRITTASSASYSVTDHLGLNVSSLPSVAWELVPFSWAVDYFTTVSPWLDDMFYTLPGTTIYCSQSLKYESRDRVSLLTYLKPGYSGYLSGGDSETTCLDFNRSSLSQLPSRSLRIKSVDEIGKSGLTKLLNLSSVLAQGRTKKI
jgi:hypothetical protein